MVLDGVRWVDLGTRGEPGPHPSVGSFADDARVPRISEFYGVVIEMFFADHPPPHFHARYGGSEALIAIDSGEVIAGELPPRARRLVREWAEMRREELAADWDRARAHEPRARVLRCHERTDQGVAVEPLADEWVRLSFSDGAVKEVNLAPILSCGGVFGPIHEDRMLFEQVDVNRESGTIEWPGDVDLDALVLYGLHEPADGPPLTRRDVTDAVSTS